MRYVRCSFPSVAAEAPELLLRRWVSMDDSDWEVSFRSKCWSIELGLEGRTMLMPFKLIVRVTAMSLKGVISLTLPNDLAFVVFSFHEMPKLQMTMDTTVSLGSVPMPLQRGASALIRAEIKKWLSNTAVAPHSLKINRSVRTQDQLDLQAEEDLAAAPAAATAYSAAAAAAAAARAARRHLRHG